MPSEEAEWRTRKERIDTRLAARGWQVVPFDQRRPPTRITAGKTFSSDQERWLDRIRDHLVQNLSIDREDFEVVPIFEQHGGWTPANRAFEGRLESLLIEINEAIAA